MGCFIQQNEGNEESVIGIGVKNCFKIRIEYYDAHGCQGTDLNETMIQYSERKK